MSAPSDIPLTESKGQMPPAEESADAKEKAMLRRASVGEDRCVPSVPPIPREPLDVDDVFADAQTGKPDLDRLKKHLAREGRLTHAAAVQILQRGADLFKREPNLLKLRDPITGM